MNHLPTASADPGPAPSPTQHAAAVGPTGGRGWQLPARGGEDSLLSRKLLQAKLSSALFEISYAIQSWELQMYFAGCAAAGDSGLSLQAAAPVLLS